ncbi:39S ribosomal protein L35, mitochondrial [Latimeria chalumnae]|uniref:Large ribosomal subunit protein bL35m n=1 Tax=Latimeria chalumnae TaxID=7897 RepID=H2ZYE6_LATCH|nr:PREDICTED: 39S ribosomal protein L35, mitochondrial [Latimeria chalumnae]|eukprot:XP_006008663.1 PREDICTED: 39S ribosomal protein L35, mitochondrial [Latimeria chalumnae]
MAAAFRSVSGLLRPFIPVTQRHVRRSSCIVQLVSRFSTLNLNHAYQPVNLTATKLLASSKKCIACPSSLPILNSVTPLLPNIIHQPVRTVTYFSGKKGKRKSVKAVVKRFLRLHCGLWLRRQAGYKKKLWKKKAARKRRLRQHIFCNKTQSKLLDKMTTSFWKRRNWFVNDPYQKYHNRTNLEV